jgi:Protein of unknown function (DUF2934)
MSEIPKKKTTPRKTAAKKKAAPPADSSYIPLTHEEVELLAYQLWVDRGRPHGGDAKDWLHAEQQLKSRQ